MKLRFRGAITDEGGGMSANAATHQAAERTRASASSREVDAAEAPTAQVEPPVCAPVPVRGLLHGGAGSLLRSGSSDELGGRPVDAPVLAVLRRRRGRGEPLPVDVSRNASDALGVDMSMVRVHADSESDQLARSVQARAFTYGADIYFSSGLYGAHAAGSSRLLAHELGHVVQAATRSSGAASVIGRADDPAEAEADRIAAQVLPALRRPATQRADAPTASSGAAVALSALHRQAVLLAAERAGGAELADTVLRRETGLVKGQEVWVNINGTEKKAKIRAVGAGNHVGHYQLSVDLRGNPWFKEELVRAAGPPPETKQAPTGMDAHLVAVIDDAERSGKALCSKFETQPAQRSGVSAATIAVKPPTFSPSGLALDVDVLCSPKDMDIHGVTLDHVILSMWPTNGRPFFRLGHVTATKENNCCNVKLVVPWAKFAPGAKGEVSQNEAAAVIPEMKVRADWLRSDGTAVHWMGGLDDKGGTGTRIRLREPTETEIAEAETFPNEALNVKDPLGPSHPIYQANQLILQETSALVTNLEVESEFTILSENGPKVVEQLIELIQKQVKADPGRFGLSKVEDNTEEPQQYRDTYHDIFGATGPTDRDLAFLVNGIVMRHRHKEGDKPGLNLFAMKGRTHQFSGTEEQSRIASQVYLTEGTLSTLKATSQSTEATASTSDKKPEWTEADPVKQKQLRTFISGADMPDAPRLNPFARALMDALGAGTGGKIDIDLARDVDAWTLEPVLIVESTRKKFVFKVKDGPDIEFSADVAYGKLANPKLPEKLARKIKDVATVCSFEFGLGHPGPGGSAPANTSTSTTSASTSAESTSSSRESFLRARSQFGGAEGKASTQPAGPSFSRAYHIPKDIENAKLIQTVDFKKFAQLRDALMRLFQQQLELKTKPGGHKATLLAQLMGLIPPKD